MKKFFSAAVLFLQFFALKAQDVVIEAFQDEEITLEIGGFADPKKSEFSFSKTSGGDYVYKDFEKETSKISFTFFSPEIYDFDFEEKLGGCENTTFVRFVIKEKTLPDKPGDDDKKDAALYVPNIFTPDGDGVNDFFHVKYENRPQSLSVSVFNRYGRKVFSSDNPDFRWDGSGCRAGTYFYVIQYGYGGLSKKVSGTLTLAD